MIIQVRPDGTLVIALVITVWRGDKTKKKKVTVEPCAPEACFAYRAVQLTPVQAGFFKILEF